MLSGGPGFAHHLCVHAPRGIDRIRRDTCALKDRRQVEREHDEGQLALYVRLLSVVMSRQHHIVELGGPAQCRQH
jgi:hypothetical protein